MTQTPTVKLITERLILRTPEPLLLTTTSSPSTDSQQRTETSLQFCQDAQGYAHLFSNPKTWEHEPHKPDLANKSMTDLCVKYENLARAFQDDTQAGKSAQMVIYLRTGASDKDDGEGEMIGCGGVNEFRPFGSKAKDRTACWVADVGVSLHSDHWRKGYAKEALTALLDWLYKSTETSSKGTYRSTGAAVQDLLTLRQNGEVNSLALVELQTLASNEPFQKLMNALGLQGTKKDDGPFGPEFNFQITRED